MRFAIRGVPARTACDQLTRVLGELDVENARGAADDLRQLVGGVQIEPEREPEPVAKRGRQQAGARGRPHERERRQVER